MTRHIIVLRRKRHHSRKSAQRSYFVSRAAIPRSCSIGQSGLISAVRCALVEGPLRPTTCPLHHHFPQTFTNCLPHDLQAHTLSRSWQPLCWCCARGWPGRWPQDSRCCAACPSCGGAGSALSASCL